MQSCIYPLPDFETCLLYESLMVHAALSWFQMKRINHIRISNDIHTHTHLDSRACRYKLEHRTHAVCTSLAIFWNVSFPTKYVWYMIQTCIGRCIFVRSILIAKNNRKNVNNKVFRSVLPQISHFSAVLFFAILWIQLSDWQTTVGAHHSLDISWNHYLKIASLTMYIQYLKDLSINVA